jgi:hypothetical protein
MNFLKLALATIIAAATLSMDAEIAVNCPHQELRLRTQSPAALEALGKAHPTSEQAKARALVKACLGPAA